jgi:hypothetical protein
MTRHHTKVKPSDPQRSSGRRVTAMGIMVAAVSVAPAIWLGPPVAATSTLGPLKSVGCAPMASDPAIEAPLYAQQEGASSKSDGWWCQLPHATQIPGGLLPLRREVAPLPQNFAIYQTVYSPAGTAKDDSITANGPPAIVIEVNVDSAMAPGATARTPQFSSSQKVVLKKGIQANVLTSGGQTDVSWSFSTTGVPRYLSPVSYVTVAGFGVPASAVIAVAKHVRPL